MRILQAGSGLTILFKRTPSKLVDAKFYIRCGSADEVVPAHEGFFHAIEHMLFNGTTNRNKGQVAKDFNKAGAYYNAETSYGHTLYHTLCPREHFEKSFSILADLVYNSNFPEDTWDKEKKTIFSEITILREMPDLVFSNLASVDAFGSSYHEILGTYESIKNASLSDIKQIHDRYYCGNNIFLVVAGNLTEKQLLKIVNTYDQWESRRAPKIKRIKKKYNPKEFCMEREGVFQNHVSFIFPLKAQTNLNSSTAFDIGMDSLYDYLYEYFVQDRGLCYRINYYISDSIKGCECLCIEIAVHEDNELELKESLLNLTRSFCSQVLTSEDLKMSRLSYLRDLMLLEEDIDKTTRMMGTKYLLGYKVDPFEAIYQAVESVSDKMIISKLEACLNSKVKVSTMRRPKDARSFDI